MIRPPRLAPGDTIGIAAPASAFDRAAFLRGVRRIRDAGYRVVYRPDIFSASGYLAGTDERRAGELMRLFADRRVRAIFCARGGYGSQRLLPLLDRGLIRKNPKILMGYSDITALHAFLMHACGLIVFHGPLVTEMGRGAAAELRRTLLLLGRAGSWGALPSPGLKALRPGRADGRLTGGSLSVFTSLLGTPYFPETAEKILFFEDRGEKPYAVDRLFSHLKLAGAFRGARGLLLGRFLPPRSWEGGRERYRAEIARIALDTLSDAAFPILADFPAGHEAPNACFPLGARVALDGEGGTVTVIEPCLQD